MKLVFVFLLFMAFTIKNNAQESLVYLNQKAPSTTPEIFAPDIISKQKEYEFGSVFSKDGTEFFYGVDINGKSEIRYTKLDGDSWITPKTIIFHENYGFNDPFLSPDENRLYYISNMPLSGVGDGKDYDIWYSTKNPEGWSKPKNAGKNINTNSNEYYISFTQQGTMYFSSNKEAVKDNNGDFDIYASKNEDGLFQKPSKLPEAINTKAYEADVFVASDESYVVFCATRKEGLGRGDLYISFKNDDGSWTKSKNMGEPINTSGHELCPFVTKDGKYFFYTSKKDIYWVDAKILEQYR